MGGGGTTKRTKQMSRTSAHGPTSEEKGGQTAPAARQNTSPAEVSQATYRRGSLASVTPVSNAQALSAQVPLHCFRVGPAVRSSARSMADEMDGDEDAPGEEVAASPKGTGSPAVLGQRTRQPPQLGALLQRAQCRTSY